MNCAHKWIEINAEKERKMKKKEKKWKERNCWKSIRVITWAGACYTHFRWNDFVLYDTRDNPSHSSMNKITFIPSSESRFICRKKNIMIAWNQSYLETEKYIWLASGEISIGNKNCTQCVCACTAHELMNNCTK